MPRPASLLLAGRGLFTEFELGEQLPGGTGSQMERDCSQALEAALPSAGMKVPGTDAKQYSTPRVHTSRRSGRYRRFFGGSIMLNICQTCTRNGRCKLVSIIAQQRLWAFKDSEDLPECPEYEERCWHGIKGVAA